MFYANVIESGHKYFDWRYSMVDMNTMSVIGSGSVDSQNYRPDAGAFQNIAYRNDFPHVDSFNLAHDENHNFYRTTGGYSTYTHTQGGLFHYDRYAGILTFNRARQEQYDFLLNIPSKYGKNGSGTDGFSSRKIYQTPGFGINDYLYRIRNENNNLWSLSIFSSLDVESYIELKYEYIQRSGYRYLVSEHLDSLVEYSTSATYLTDISQYPFTSTEYAPVDSIYNVMDLLPSKDKLALLKSGSGGLLDFFVFDLQNGTTIEIDKTCVCQDYSVDTLLGGLKFIEDDILLGLFSNNMTPSSEFRYGLYKMKN